jgi:hypothetical protein
MARPFAFASGTYGCAFDPARPASFDLSDPRVKEAAAAPA